MGRQELRLSEQELNNGLDKIRTGSGSDQPKIHEKAWVECLDCVHQHLRIGW